MDYAKIWVYWVMFQYAVACALFAFKADFGRASYWFFCIGVTFAASFLIK